MIACNKNASTTWAAIGVISVVVGVVYLSFGSTITTGGVRILERTVVDVDVDHCLQNCQDGDLNLVKIIKTMYIQEPNNKPYNFELVFVIKYLHYIIKM